jgi:hypothetical protein
VKKFLHKLIALVEGFLTFAVALLSRQGFDTKRYRFNISEVWYSPWNEDDKFNAFYRMICQNTLISKRKLFDLYQIGAQINRSLQGIVLEVGTYRGGSSGLLASVFPEKELILWDIWNKVVEEDSTFVKKIYAASSDLQEAKQLLSKTGTNSAIKASFIDDIFPNATIISEWQSDISLIHFDIYDSNAFMLGIDLLWPRLAMGGVFIVGGYGSISLNPLTDAVNKFVENSNCLFIESQSGMGLIFKLHQK